MNTALCRSFTYYSIIFWLCSRLAENCLYDICEIWISISCCYTSAFNCEMLASQYGSMLRLDIHIALLDELLLYNLGGHEFAEDVHRGVSTLAGLGRPVPLLYMP